jgi:Fe2+ or Zn2+ uptake regulation protein
MEKYSKQREEVFNCIKDAKNHPTAEEITQKCRFLKITVNGTQIP